MEGECPYLGDLLTMGINHLQVLGWSSKYPQIRVHPIHPYPSPRCLNEATPRRKHLLFQLPLLRLEIPPWSDDFFKKRNGRHDMGKWHEMKNTGLPFVFWFMWKLLGNVATRAKCIKNNTNNSNVSWRILENSDKMLRLGSSVTICFGWFWHVLGWKYILRMWNVLWPQTVHQLFQAAPPRLKAEFPAF